MLSATALRIFTSALAELGVSWEPLLRGAGLDPAVVSDSEARITQESWERIWSSASRMTGDPCVGLHAGERVHPRAVNLAGYLLLSSAHIREGLERVARYQRVLTGTPWLSIEDSERWVHVRVGMEHGDDEVRAIHAEYVAALVIRSLSWVTETDVTPVEACFRHAPRSEPAEYGRVLGCPVKFECSHSELILSPDSLDRPSVHANEEIALVHVELGERLLARAEDQRVTAEVKRALAALLESGPRDLEAVARRLHLSPRTLQRRLASEGCTFKGLRESLRRELALRYLRDSDAPIGEISWLTGFSDVSAFSRAVRRWVGCAPEQYRRQEAETGS